MSDADLRFGLIGCGHIARRHAELLGTGQVDGATLTAVCDIVPERAQTLGEQYDVPHFTDLREVLARDDVDVACILTPSGLHHDHALAAAAAGKHVLVEKPMALRLDHADSMIRACDEAKVRLFVVKQCRFNVPVRRAREALDDGRFGTPLSGSARLWWRRDQDYYDQAPWRGTWALDGGVLMNQAIHHIDLLQWFLGPANSVRAAGRTALLDIEVEDSAVATVTFANGALGVIDATTATRPRSVEGSVSILGSGGTVEIGGVAADRLVNWEFCEKIDSDDRPLDDFSNPAGAAGYGHKSYYDEVVKALRGEESAAVDGREGRQSLALVTALYAAMESGETVSLDSGAAHSRLGRG